MRIQAMSGMFIYLSSSSHDSGRIKLYINFDNITKRTPCKELKCEGPCACDCAYVASVKQA